MKMNSITITNVDTYYKLQQIFKGKEPTDRTILIFKLLLEGHIDKEEADILNHEGQDKINDKQGGGFKLVHKLNQANYRDITKRSRT